MDILDIQIKEENVSDSEENEVDTGQVLIKEEVILPGKENNSCIF